MQPAPHQTALYRNVDRVTASPQSLMLLGLRRVRALLINAKDAIEQQDIASRAQNLSKALDIVIYWQSMLGEGVEDKPLAGGLNTHYDFLKANILSVNASDQPDASRLDECLEIVDHLVEFWTNVE